MSEMEDYLLHFGVKGMHWGVRRSLSTHLANHRKAKMQKLDAYHKKHKKQFFYGANYNLKEAGGNKYKAIKRAKFDSRLQKTQLAFGLTLMAAAPFASKGVKLTNKFLAKATDPNTILKGKNILQALKRSKFRYVNGAAMKNVVYNSGSLMKR